MEIEYGRETLIACAGCACHARASEFEASPDRLDREPRVRTEVVPRPGHPMTSWVTGEAVASVRDTVQRSSAVWVTARATLRGSCSPSSW